MPRKPTKPLICEMTVIDTNKLPLGVINPIKAIVTVYKTTPPKTKTCPSCREEFIITRNDTLYCSKKCANKCRYKIAKADAVVHLWDCGEKAPERPLNAEGKEMLKAGIKNTLI